MDAWLPCVFSSKINYAINGTIYATENPTLFSLLKIQLVLLKSFGFFFFFFLRIQINFYTFICIQMILIFQGLFNFSQNIQINYYFEKHLKTKLVLIQKWNNQFGAKKKKIVLLLQFKTNWILFRNLRLFDVILKLLIL